MVIPNLRVVVQVCFICIDLGVEAPVGLKNHRKTAGADVDRTPMRDALDGVDIADHVIEMAFSKALDGDTLCENQTRMLIV